MNFVLEMVVKLLAADTFVETTSRPASRRTSHIHPFFMENNHSLLSTFDPTIAPSP